MPDFLLVLGMGIVALGLVALALRIRLRRRGGMTAIGRQARQQWRAWGGWNPVDVTAEAARRPAAILFAGGIFLVWAGQVIYAVQPPPWRYAVWFVMGLGGASFLLGGQLAVRHRVPAGFVTLTRRISGALGVQSYQLLLLALALPAALLVRPAAGEMLAARYPWVATLCWLAALLAAAAGAYRPVSPASRPALSTWAGVLLLTIVAFLLRGTGIAHIPPTFSGDEGSAGLVAVDFFAGRADNLFTFGWFSFPSFYFALQGLGIGALGQTVEGVRMSSAVAGAATVPLVFWLGRTLFGSAAGWLAAFYLAVSHYHIHMSRIGLNNVWDGFFAAGVLAALWHGWRSGRRASFLLCGVLLGLSQYFYVTTRVLPLLLLAWAGGAYLLKRQQFRRRFFDLALAAFVAFVAFMPLGLLFAAQPDEFQAPMQRVTIMGPWLEREMALTGDGALVIIARQVATTALGFTHEPLQLLYNPGAPLLLGGAAALFLVGLLWALFRFGLDSLLLLLPLAAMVGLGGLSQSPPASQRFVLVMPVVAVLLARPLAESAQWLIEAWPRARVPVVAVVVLTLALIGTTDLRYYFDEVYESYVLGGGNTETATAIADYLLDQENQRQTVYFFGLPRMGYYSLATIPYLVPEMEGVEIARPLGGPPTWPVKGQSLFIFLPERERELALVREAFPGGRVERHFRLGGQLDFVAYHYSPPDD